MDTALRLQVYVIEVAVLFLLGFALLEGEKARTLVSAANRGDLIVAATALIAIFLWNLEALAGIGYRASPEPGFADATALILVFFVALNWRRNIRPMLAPNLSLGVARGDHDFH